MCSVFIEQLISGNLPHMISHMPCQRLRLRPAGLSKLGYRFTQPFRVRRGSISCFSWSDCEPQSVAAADSDLKLRRCGWLVSPNQRSVTIELPGCASGSRRLPLFGAKCRRQEVRPPRAARTEYNRPRLPKRLLRTARMLQGWRLQPRAAGLSTPVRRNETCRAATAKFHPGSSTRPPLCRPSSR